MENKGKYDGIILCLPNFGTYPAEKLENISRLGGVKYLQDIIRKMQVGGGTLLSGVSYAGWRGWT